MWTCAAVASRNVDGLTTRVTIRRGWGPALVEVLVPLSAAERAWPSTPAHRLSIIIITIIIIIVVVVVIIIACSSNNISINHNNVIV